MVIYTRSDTAQLTSGKLHVEEEINVKKLKDYFTNISTLKFSQNSITDLVLVTLVLMIQLL